MNARRLFAPLAAAAVVAALLSPGAGPAAGLPAAEAAPAGLPAFSNPLAVSNPLFPVVPGTIKVYLGREGARRITVVERHLEETRSFPWQGGTVACRVLVEMKFADGVNTEISRSYFAQGDDGAVYEFGEIPVPVAVPQDPEDGSGDAESKGWVVGSRVPDDPADTVEGAKPALHMPVGPGPGDTWKPEDLLPFVDETDRVIRDGAPIRVPAGLFRGCLEVRESSVLGPGRETKWYAPGVGAVRARAAGMELRLQAGTGLRR